MARDSRPEVAAGLAQLAIDRLDMPFNKVFLTRYDVMADALAASSFGQLILLTDLDMMPAPTESFLRGRQVHEVGLVGGPTSITSDVEKMTCTILGGDDGARAAQTN